jgi:hypothetical protein
MKTYLSLFLYIATAVSIFADAGVMPRTLFDPTVPGAEKQLQISGDSGSQMIAEIKDEALVLTLKPGESNWPGMQIVPAGSARLWDLSIYGHVEMKVENLGDNMELINLRVDNASSPENRNPWNAEMARIEPGKSAVIRVFFGYSYNFQRAYPLDPSAVVRLLIFTGKLDHEVKLRITDIKAAGWQGEKPGSNPDESRLKPKDGIVFNETVAASKALKISSMQGADATVRENSVYIDFTKADSASVSIKPPVGFWDFSDHMRAVFKVKNTGETAISPRFVLDSIFGPTATIAPASPIAPGAVAEVVIPFAPELPWTAPNDPAQSDCFKGGSWDAIPGTGTSFRNHKVRTLSVLPDEGNEKQSFEILSFTVDQPPVKLPEWLGKRPPVDGDWTLTLNQNFDKKQLDLNTFSVYWFHWWDKRQHNSKDNVFLRDGKLVLRTEKKTGFLNDDPLAYKFPGELPDRTPETPYATGWVDTFGKWTQRYGYFEFRLKMPRQACLWPAIWMMPDRGLERNPRGLPKLDWSHFRDRTDTFYNGMEIDIVEGQTIWGPHRFNTACHFDGYGKEHKKMGTSANYVETDEEGFMVVGMLWLPGSLSFYGNGKIFWHWESPRVCDEQMYVQFQNQIGGWDYDPLDDLELPADFEIDYMRVWQRKDLATDEDGHKPNDGGLDGRLGPGLSTPRREDPRDPPRWAVQAKLAEEKFKESK